MLSDSVGIEPEGIPEGYTFKQKVIIGVVVVFVGFILLAALAFSYVVNSLPDDYAGWYCEQETIIAEEDHFACDLGQLRGNYEIS